VEGKVKKPLREETPLAITLAMLSLGGVACIVLMLGLALIPLLEVGGFCAEGGPYEIRQECPSGVTPVMAGGIPLGLLLCFVYIVSIPSSWKPMIMLAWPAVFGFLGIAFVIGAFTTGGTFQIGSFLIGLMMLAFGIGPTWLVRRSGEPLYPDRTKGVPAQIAVIAIGFLLAVWLWFQLST